MTIEICTVGGYNEVGKNCTTIRVDDEIVVMDLGLHLENYIKYTEEEREELRFISGSKLIEVGAAPDISVIKQMKGEVKAIIPTHAHLDHIGAIPFLGHRFRKAEILCSPYTNAVLSAILKDEKIDLRNKIKVLNVNSVYKVSDKIKIEFINITHSTPQTVMVAIHTPEGIVLYANDFKFDNNPTLGKKPNYDRLKRLKNVRALISDSIYSRDAMKTPSELVAKDMLKDVLLGVKSKNKALIVTTFSSHLARLKSIIECGRQLHRKIVFLGRSLSKYVSAGEDIGLINFSKDVELVKYRNQIKKRLRQIEKEGRDKYLIVMTGHQGEPKAVLSRIVHGSIPFSLYPNDILVFSCRVIPTKINIDNRKYLEDQLKKLGVRIFKDVHVSGHAAKEDDRDLLEILEPDHIIPAHAEDAKKIGLIELGNELGYKKGKTSHLMHDGDRLTLS